MLCAAIGANLLWELDPAVAARSDSPTMNTIRGNFQWYFHVPRVPAGEPAVEGFSEAAQDGELAT